MDDRLEVIVITADAEPLRFTEYISSTELNEIIIEASATLKNKTTDYQALQKLHQYLIEPFEAQLKDFGIENIIYAPDGALRYIPLAALYDGEKWLIEKYRTTNITALSLTSFADKPKKVVDILGAAFPDTKQTISVETAVSTREFGFGGLPAATQEIEGIASVFPVEKRLAGDFGKNIYSEFNLYSVIHLATHAKFLPGTPEDSFIVFGNGEYTNLKEIGEKWKFTEDQLVVLSACETGLGTDFTELNAENNGIEIVGLAYQMQRRGAQSTVASLWQVQDDSTEKLMTEFYRQLQQSNISKAEALRIAQETISQNPEYAHPYHWASFVMIGNGL
ncbi:CHAT domain-containing protein [[Leptolyngbya] sp. PCC 7376]|uniref:CHAT domain-containing protein n=1 Tax=[Leptolyngbya] sp. PCC 7376 TaxID=111781 RepID=UPI0002F2F695|nr:CHAT domain-containing protein [[Leptolyngbya] sp. PCC 7376]